jgi:hypothetical protein
MKTQIHLSWLLFHSSYVPFNFNRWCHIVHKNNGDKHVTPTIKNEIRKLTVTPSTIEIFDKMVIKMFPLFVNWRIGMVVLFHCKMFVYLAKAY